MNLWIFFAAAAGAYLVGSINPAIIISQAVYRVDVRRYGSHNAGFTNFNRTFGSQHAWTVFIIDFSKSLLLSLGFGWLFVKIIGMFQLGAAYTAIFTLLGHVYPVWHHFQGGKGVSVMFAAACVVEWRAAVVILITFLILMVLTRYMSLSVMFAALTGPVVMGIRGVEHPAVLIIFTCCVLFMIWRHKENIQRLIKGTESRFSLKDRKKTK